MNEEDLKSMLDQIIANQTVLYDMIRILSGESKSKPKKWVVEEFEAKADEFKSL